MVVYEQKLGQDFAWALREGSMHFENRSAVHDTLRRIAKKLDDLGIPYAVSGGMALFAHGFRRFTEDVDLLVTEEGLREIHTLLAGKGYLPLFKGSRNLRDTDSGVRVEFIVTGQYPGDGKAKLVAFPNPADVGVVIEGIRFLQLPKLIELKLASGISSPGRLRDLADVLELIRLLSLPADFSKQLDASVRDKYTELWQSAQEDIA